MLRNTPIDYVWLKDEEEFNRRKSNPKLNWTMTFKTFIPKGGKIYEWTEKDLWTCATLRLDIDAVGNKSYYVR